MSNLPQKLSTIHQHLAGLPARLLIIGLGFLHVGLVMWEPTDYANHIGGFNLPKSLLLIWGMCSSMIHGVGFTPRKVVWQIFFSPLISLVILLAYTILYFS